MGDVRAGIPTHALVSAVQNPDAGLIGVAVILRDRRRDTVHSTSNSTSHRNIAAATYAALSEALLTARENGAYTMTVYCDVASVVLQLNKQQDVPAELRSANLQLRALCNRFRRVDIKLAQSGTHFTAHKLAAGAAQVPAQRDLAQSALQLPLTGT